jgi:hypothetical protein
MATAKHAWWHALIGMYVQNSHKEIEAPACPMESYMKRKVWNMH